MLPNQEYTITIRNYLEMMYPTTPEMERIQKCVNELVPTYPLYDESHRNELNTKILQRYYFNEIGFETPAMFWWYFKSKMDLIMPYYNQLYESEKLTYDPLTNVDDSWSTRTEKQKNYNDDKTDTTNASDKTDTQTTENGSENQNTESTERYWDTPQTELNPSDMSYATNLTNTKDTSTTQTENTTSQGTENTSTKNQTVNSVGYVGEDNTETKTHSGNTGIPYPDLIKKHREQMLNIDQRIIEELRDLFMMIY